MGDKREDEPLISGVNICGGVISKSLFNSDPILYMMAWYMEDEQFEKYKSEGDEKRRRTIFSKHARSAI